MVESRGFFANHQTKQLPKFCLFTFLGWNTRLFNNEPPTSLVTHICRRKFHVFPQPSTLNGGWGAWLLKPSEVLFFLGGGSGTKIGNHIWCPFRSIYSSIKFKCPCPWQKKGSKNQPETDVLQPWKLNIDTESGTLEIDEHWKNLKNIVIFGYPPRNKKEQQRPKPSIFWV